MPQIENSYSNIPTNQVYPCKFEVGRFLALIQAKGHSVLVNVSRHPYPWLPPPTLRNLLFLYLPQFSRMYQFRWFGDQVREDFFLCLYVLLLCRQTETQQCKRVIHRSDLKRPEGKYKLSPGCKNSLNGINIFQLVY